MNWLDPRSISMDQPAAPRGHSPLSGGDGGALYFCAGLALGQGPRRRRRHDETAGARSVALHPDGAAAWAWRPGRGAGALAGDGAPASLSAALLVLRRLKEAAP